MTNERMNELINSKKKEWIETRIEGMNKRENERKNLYKNERKHKQWMKRIIMETKQKLMNDKTYV